MVRTVASGMDIGEKSTDGDHDDCWSRCSYSTLDQRQRWGAHGLETDRQTGRGYLPSVQYSIVEATGRRHAHRGASASQPRRTPTATRTPGGSRCPTADSPLSRVPAQEVVAVVVVMAVRRSAAVSTISSTYCCSPYAVLRSGLSTQPDSQSQLV